MYEIYAYHDFSIQEIPIEVTLTDLCTPNLPYIKILCNGVSLSIIFSNLSPSKMYLWIRDKAKSKIRCFLMRLRSRNIYLWHVLLKLITSNLGNASPEFFCIDGHVWRVSLKFFLSDSTLFYTERRTELSIS